MKQLKSRFVFIVLFFMLAGLANIYAETIIEEFEDSGSFGKVTSEGSRLELKSVAGKKGQALSMEFDFTAAKGYAVALKDLPLTLPESFNIKFFLRGTGPDNNLEFKFVDKDGNVFWKKWQDYIFHSDWKEITVRKRDIVFAWGPNAGTPLKDVVRIEFGVSCGQGGKGTVEIDSVRLFPVEGVKTFNISASASTAENEDYSAQKTVDGKNDTRWSSLFEDKQWLLLDLGRTEEIVGLKIFWEAAYGKIFDILVSEDKSKWEKVYSTDSGDGDTDDINFLRRKARYIKLDLKKRGTAYGFSIFEITVKGKDREVLFSASSDDGKNKIQSIYDGSPATGWVSSDSASQWAQLDFQKKTEYGGFTLYWGDAYASDYDLKKSDDGKNWEKIYSARDGNGQRDRIFVKDGESRYVRIEMLKGPGKRYSLNEIEIKGPEEAASPLKFFEIAAEENPRGYYPKYFFNVQTYWTIVGVSGDVPEALFNEEGAFEVDKEMFSLEPFIYANGKLITWGDVTIEQRMEKGYLPIPEVIWKHNDLELSVQLIADGIPGKSAIIARYRIKNKTKKNLAGSFYAAIRPFQVNPPWQCLNMTGGPAKINSISYDGKTVRVNDKKTVIPLDKPSGFGAAAYEAGDITAFISKKQLPDSKSVADSFGYASGAFEFAFDIPPVSEKDIHIAVPFQNYNLGLLPNLTGDDAAKIYKTRFDDNVKFWDGKVSSFEINLPGKDKKLVEVIKSNLAYILINKDNAGTQPGSRSYDRSWIRDGAMTSSALLKMGMIDEVREYADWYAGFIFPDGKVPCAVDYRGAEHCPENDSNGEYIYLCNQYYSYTGDKNFLESHSDKIIKAADYIIYLRNQRKTDEYRSGPDAKKVLYGLVPESISHEGYSAKPMHSYWDDFFALKGLKDVVNIMGVLGREELKKKYAAEAIDFRKALYDSISLSMKMHKIDYIPGCAELGDFDATSTSIGIYPCDEVDYMPRKELIFTMERYFKDLERRLIPGNNWGEAFTPYELRTVRSFVYLDDKEKAFTMLDYLLTTMRPFAWNHWAEVVWRVPETPKFIGDMPHTWVGSDYVNSARSLLVIENENTGNLILCKAVRESWLDFPEGISVKNLPTLWGHIDFHLFKAGERVKFSVSGKANPPGKIILTSPLAKPVKKVTLNGKDWKAFTAHEITFTALPAEIVIEY